MFALMIEAACWFAVASPALLVIGGMCSLVSDYRFQKSLK